MNAPRTIITSARFIAPSGTTSPTNNFTGALVVETCVSAFTTVFANVLLRYPAFETLTLYFPAGTFAISKYPLAFVLAVPTPSIATLKPSFDMFAMLGATYPDTLKLPSLVPDPTFTPPFVTVTSMFLRFLSANAALPFEVIA